MSIIGGLYDDPYKTHTFHSKTNKPENDGLFCERIFGRVFNLNIFSIIASLIIILLFTGHLFLLLDLFS